MNAHAAENRKSFNEVLVVFGEGLKKGINRWLRMLSNLMTAIYQVIKFIDQLNDSDYLA